MHGRKFLFDLLKTKSSLSFMHWFSPFIALKIIDFDAVRLCAFLVFYEKKEKQEKSGLFQSESARCFRFHLSH
jgi:hypothetical protein